MNYALGDHTPEVDDDAWVAPNASLMGKVEIKKDASVWWNVVLRGDNEPIILGEGSNIQDGSVVHTDPGTPAIIGKGVTIGHMVMLHGCEIGDNCLVGIGAVVLNGAKIGKNCLIGANSLITENKVIPDNSMVLGSPGKVVRELSPEQIEGLKRSANSYVNNGKRYNKELRAID
jgi:carbonic anhydrase/acetyltransferase-like protein (isoleucine patch superfamily)